MDHLRSTPGNGEDNVGIPDDMRCKRSDGKQWRCTAMSMPDKTVCEKHYIQAKKRAANSAMRANMKKAKRKSLGESDVYLESKSDDFDVPLASIKSEEFSRPSPGKKFTKISRNQFRYSPDPPPMRSVSRHNPPNDERESDEYEEDWSSYKTPPVSALDSSMNRPQSFDANAMTVSESSDGSSESSQEAGGQTCHQCRRKDDTVIWCHRCDRRGYCDSCIRTWYSNTPLEDIQSSCPACCGTCNCKVCLRRDNLVKVRIREIPALDKLQYLHCLLSSVLPVVKQIHQEQCFEVELEKKLRGSDIDLARTKLNADEQMCCNFCRIPIIDYHWHCPNCAYDLCLNCCLDLREASMQVVKGEVSQEIGDENQEKGTVLEQLPKVRLIFSEKFSDWKANSDGSIPCPPKEYGGCGYSTLSLSRIFKMNWVAKLVKNVEEMVSGCRVNDADHLEKTEVNDPRLCQYAHREDSDNFLYCPSSQDIKSDGIANFKRHWLRGEPIIVKRVFDSSSVSSWDPMVIWRGIRETTDEKSKDQNRKVKAIDCYDWSEVDIEVGHFIEGYSEGQIYENGRPKILKLKDWPSPSASEEFLLYQRPEFISKLPLLEYIHSKFGLLNVAAKLPHYSLQNDVGPKIFISYGTHEELDRGNSVTNLHFNMRDMVYLLVHACEVKQKGRQKTKTENMQKPFEESEVKESHEDLEMGTGDSTFPDLSIDQNEENPYEARLDTDKVDSAADHGIETTPVEGNTISCEQSEKEGDDISQKTHPGVFWDVFRRKDVPKLTEYLRIHGEEFGKLKSETNNFVTRPLYDETLFLNENHKRKLKEEFGVEPWSFEQNLGQAVFIPAGCPFQVRNLQSTVQLGLDFLSPESLGDAARLAEEIRCLPNDHEAKQQVLEVGQGKFYVEVGKISLYAASSAIKEIQKLVLDPKFSGELGFEDPNLIAAVSENLEKITKRRQIACT
ncbi:putative transcription factor interactor and regulator C3H-WRC/GRF family [Rosa chinensis]|uniref:Putative transcription factor interactor and regulator C3H-WRC/GRF family n=1 Tax=Rosa chinensis TaxID=74649 RepID=A0A2P6R741_ROSCH|nr:lysine-specific demethylase JMJ25 isoform X1 [Rosa chinensis]XP_024187509.1 lysine-specific demethylase JMJ25 isoform X1 [Rosa chinensis]PRQ42227.1 putative transcription factor interactor and regulator C3H-WRC/GRF family [Rosa chinensis]